MCRDDDDGWVAVEIKRVATIDAVEQLHRYLERIQLRSRRSAACRGVLAAQVFKPQARVLAESRGIDCVEVDLAVLRGEREPDLTLFAASRQRTPSTLTRRRGRSSGMRSTLRDERGFTSSRSGHAISDPRGDRALELKATRTRGLRGEMNAGSMQTHVERASRDRGLRRARPATGLERTWPGRRPAGAVRASSRVGLATGRRSAVKTQDEPVVVHVAGPDGGRDSW